MKETYRNNSSFLFNASGFSVQTVTAHVTEVDRAPVPSEDDGDLVGFRKGDGINVQSMTEEGTWGGEGRVWSGGAWGDITGRQGQESSVPESSSS